MSEPLRLVLAAVAGMLLGTAYFAGLWWTLRKINGSAFPGGLILLSFLLRNLVVAAGFVFASGGTWQGVAACLVGFVVARIIVVRVLAGKLAPGPGNDGGERIAGDPR